MSLFEIDKLIRKTEYDEALRQLNIYVEKNPDQFDNVQTRISKIMNAKISYSELAEKLLEIIRNDPTNNKRIYEITAQLEKFERNPSDKNLQFIADIKKSAEFNYFRAQFLEIQEAMAENIQKQKYTQAITKAQEGFWLYKDNFYIKWEDEPGIISSVESLVNDLNTHLALFTSKNFLLDISKAVNEFVKEVNIDNYDNAVKKFNVAKQKMKEYNTLRSNIINDKVKMENAVAQLQTLDPDMSDASYLPFLIHFLTGVDVVKDSGIITALNNQWNDYIFTMNDSVFSMVSRKYNKYTEGITQEFSSNLENYVKLNNEVLALYNLPNSTEVTYIDNPYTDYEILLSYVENLCSASLEANSLLTSVNENKTLQDTEIALIKNVDGENKQPNLNKLVSYCEELEDIAQTREDFDSSYRKWNSDYKNSTYDNFDGLTKQYEETVDEIYKIKDETLNNTWYVITNYYMDISEKLYTELKNYTLAFDDFNNGLTLKLTEENHKEIDKDISKAVLYKNKENGEDDLGIYYRYPNITVEMTSYVEDQIEKRVKIINECKKELNKMFGKNPLWKNENMLANKVIKANKFLEQQITNLENLNKDVENAYDEALNYIGKSKLAKNEADTRFKEAEKALKNEDFSLARRKLQNAVTKYDESLNNQNDEELRTKWDNKLQNLGDEIARQENELIVREVRVLKNKAKDAYFNGRFDDAEKYLNQASAKWSITNVTEDPEITNLRNFVNTAISMKTGRDILPSAPQYPEMSQLINIARTSYDEGSKLLDMGQNELADEQFEIALSSIQKVQYVYPLNQEAALITLQINRIKDPEKFKDEFANKIESAKMLCKSSDTQQEGYANLLDYYKLDPNYPGLKELIYQVEIDIGIRQKPVDNSGKIKANNYIAEAKKIYRRAGDDPVKLNNALEKVNLALNLVPYNEEAMDLKDKITTKMGGTIKTSLSIEDERMYQNAIKCLMENKIATARNIVDELLQKPENRYSTKIKDLKKQIDARS